MPTSTERLLDWPFKDIRQSYNERDTMLYALSVGFGQDPSDPRQLRYVHGAAPLHAVPSMAVILGRPGAWHADPAASITWSHLVHGEQGFTLYRPLPVSGTIRAREHVVRVVDNGLGKGASLYVAREIHYDADDTLESTMFCRADGGFGGSTQHSQRRIAAPEGPPEHEVHVQAALLYRLNGDSNTLHADSAFARKAGFDRPILHGLCTLGLAIHAVLRTHADYQAALLHGPPARFSAPFFPGETLLVQSWRARKACFSGRARQSGTSLSSMAEGATRLPCPRLESNYLTPQSGDTMNHPLPDAAHADVPTAKADETLIGADVITEALIKKKIPYLFGVSGHGFMGLLDATYDHQDKLKTISVHHESVGPFMADAYYRITRKPAAAFASCGPGASNLYVSVATAQADSSAMLVLTGNVATQHWNRGTFQESSEFFQGDYVNSLRPYVKRAFQPTRADMLPSAMRQVFQTLETGRPGPVHLDVPFNVFREPVKRAEIEKEAWADAPMRRTAPAGDPEAVREVMALLAKAERPVIVAGHGIRISGGEPALHQLVDLLRLPMAVTPLGKDLIDNRHPLCIGQVGRNGSYQGNCATRNADVIVAIGTRFDDRASSAWVPGATYDFSKTKLIHIDVDPGQLGKNYPVHLGIVGDARMVLGQMLEIARQTRFEPSAAVEAWWNRIYAWREVWSNFRGEHSGSDAIPVRPERMITDLRNVLPDNGILVADVGLHHNWMSTEFDAHQPRTFLHNWGFGAMGFGVAGPLGAKLAAPDRPVVAVCGDGGFMMLPSPVLTAVEYDIPVVWVVWNNCGYVSIRDVHAGTLGGGREIATSFRHEASGELFSTDIAALARAMGAHGHTVERPGDFKPLLETAIRSNKPTVLDVRMQREAHVPVTGSWELPPFAPLRPTLPWE